jgi:predicted dehydrogenase/ribosomal protein S18 acetylase RimI-like enzyme
MSSPLKAAVIGLGMGARHAEAYDVIPGVELAMLCDLDQQELEAVGSAYPGVTLTADWLDVVASDVDVVSVCTPDHLHYEQATALAQVGKHLLVEKPMATTLAEARDLVDLVYERGVTLAVGNILRYVPQFALALDYAREGRLGEPFFVEADYVHDMREVFERTPWRTDPERPQDAILGGGVHPIDLLRRAAGRVTEVYACGNAKTLPGYNTPDCILISLRFESGCVGKVWISFGVRQRPHNRTTLAIYGDAGSVRVNSLRAQAEVYIEGMASEQTSWATIPLPSQCGHPVREELENLVDSIRYDRTPRVGVVDGARTVAVMAAGRESLASGLPVEVGEVVVPRSLEMERSTLDDPPSLAMGLGYGLRTFQPGDEAHWLRICLPEFGLNWDAEGLHREILDAPFFKPEDMFFVTYRGEPVGVAAAWRREGAAPDLGTLHYIAVLPEHRGQGLGRVLIGAVLRRLNELGFRRCDLRTNDYRWSALGLYCHYGYRPVIENGLDRRRWVAISRRLGMDLGLD